MNWFGEPWPKPDWRAPVCENDAERKPTPVGQPCSWCMEPIGTDDNGVLMPHVGMSESGAHFATVQPMHKECLVRSTTGGIAHLDGQCSCHGGPGVDTGLTERQEALEVYRRLVEEPF